MSQRKIRVVSYNVWGIYGISAQRSERISEIGRRLAGAEFPPHIVGLQECFCSSDYRAIRKETSEILPYGKYYHSGIFGGGLVILSKWPIEESNQTGYSLNGLPWAFWRGDWYVGKGIAFARIRIPGSRVDSDEYIDVYNTHLHAPYHVPSKDIYLTHRLSQAWQLSKLLQMSASSIDTSLVIAMGDFNSKPNSLVYEIITRQAQMKDSWAQIHPIRHPEVIDIFLSHNLDELDNGPRENVPTVYSAIHEFGATCDSGLNTWRWTGQKKKLAQKENMDVTVLNDEPDGKAKRLDYIFYSSGSRVRTKNSEKFLQDWRVESVNVGMTSHHPKLKCSLSDHFSVEVTLVECTNTCSTDDLGIKRSNTSSGEVGANGRLLDATYYDAILRHIFLYTNREKNHRRLRLAHFGLQLLVSIGCLIGAWFSALSLSFALLVIGMFGLSMGLLDGLMGGLFINSELNALREFEWDVNAYKNRVVRRVASV